MRLDVTVHVSKHLAEPAPDRLEIAEVPGGVCLTEAGLDAILARYRELGRKLTRAETRKLLIPAT